MKEKIYLYQTPSDLYQKVTNRIEKEKSIIKVRNRLIISSIIFTFSISFFVLSIIFFFSAAYNSGFSQTFSLLFSDFSIISSYYKNFALSLLESLPVFNIIASLVSVLFVYSFAKLLARDIRNLITYTYQKY